MQFNTVPHMWVDFCEETDDEDEVEDVEVEDEEWTEEDDIEEMLR